MNTIDTFSSKVGAMILAGPPGAGKTVLCTQMPAPYIVHTDNNIQGPLRFLKSNPKFARGVKFDTPFTDDKGQPLDRLKRYARCAQLAIAAANDPTIKTICFELTSLVDIMLDEVRRQQGRKIANGVTTFIDDPMQIQDWGAFAALLKNFVITMKTTGKLIIFCVHIETKEDVNDGSKTAKLLKYISCPGQLRETLAGYFDEVWLIEIEEKTDQMLGIIQKRFLRTSPSGFREAALGLKSSSLGRRVELNFETITKAIEA